MPLTSAFPLSGLSHLEKEEFLLHILQIKNLQSQNGLKSAAGVVKIQSFYSDNF